MPNDDTPNEASSISVPLDASVEPDPTTATTTAALVFETGSIVIGTPSLVHKDRNYLLVGRQAVSCDIRISHKSLSRQHAVLYYRGSSLWVMDLHTKSGTTVNDSRIKAHQPVQLNPNDTIQWAKAQPIFKVRWESPQQTTKANDTVDQAVVTVTLPDTLGVVSSNHDDNNEPVSTSRSQRHAEIAAMVASLDQAPSYTKYVPTEESTSSNLPNPTTSTVESSRMTTITNKYKLPLQEATTWAVTESTGSSHSAVAMDPSGARFAIGSMDSSLRLYDFGGFNPDNPCPFQNIYVQEGYPTRSIAYAPSGDRYVVATGSAQPRVMDRDGSDEVLEFLRGDVYVTDPAKTSGHTAAVTCVQWHPMEKSIVYTTSRDGSLRMWNVDNGNLAFGMLKCQDVIIVKNLKSGRKTIPTCMAISTKFIAMGTECGSLQIYAHPFVSKLRPQQSTIVQPDKSILCVVYSADGTKIACRMSTTVVVYTTERRLSKSTTPILTCTNVGTMDEADNSTPTMAFSPNGKVLCIGVTEQRNENGTLHLSNRLDVYLMPKDSSADDTTKKALIFSRPLSGLNDSIMGLCWHFKLNQVLVTTSKSFQLWYSVDHSQKGVLLSTGAQRRRTKRKLEEDLQEMYQARAPPPGSNVRYEEIIAPNALPMFGGDSKQKRKQKKLDQQEEDIKRKNPQQPSKSVYNTPNTIFAQLVVDNLTANKKVIAGKDPREALAQYSEGKSYISSAYEGNHERILAERTVEEEEDEMKKR